MARTALLNSFDCSTRRKRRAAFRFALDLLERVRIAEEAYLGRIPENLQSGDAYAAADETVDILTDGIVFLSDAFYA